MVENFERSLFELKNSSAIVSAANVYPEGGNAGVKILFSEGTTLQASFWRVISNGKARVSSFDHRQKYGLPAPLDAIAELQKELQNKIVIVARLDKESGDLLFHFDGNVKVQILNLTGYEDWEIHFSNGTGEYSNFVR